MCFQQHQHEANLDRPHALLQIAHCPSEFPIPLLVLGFRIQYQKEQKTRTEKLRMRWQSDVMLPTMLPIDYCLLAIYLDLKTLKDLNLNTIKHHNWNRNLNLPAVYPFIL